MKALRPTIHVHLKRDGRVFVLGQGKTGYQWFSLSVDRLQSALADAKTQGSVVEYSRDDPESDPLKSVELVFKIITSFEMPMKLLREPPFPLPSA